jgi:sulfur carrier protein
MSEGLTIQVNGQQRTFAELPEHSQLIDVISELALKSDRIAMELNGEIAPRTSWATVLVKSGDKLEIVHFVGGGA